MIIGCIRLPTGIKVTCETAKLNTPIHANNMACPMAKGINFLTFLRYRTIRMSMTSTNRERNKDSVMDVHNPSWLIFSTACVLIELPEDR